MTKQEEMMIYKEVQEACIYIFHCTGQNPEKAKELIDKEIRENFPDTTDRACNFLHKCIDFLAKKEKAPEHHYSLQAKMM